LPPSGTGDTKFGARKHPGVEHKIKIIEAPCSKLQGIFEPQGSTIYSNRSLTPQQATGNALAPGFTRIRPCPISENHILSALIRVKDLDPRLSSLWAREQLSTKIRKTCYFSNNKLTSCIYEVFSCFLCQNTFIFCIDN
jgi:hypothetical protein